MTDILERAEEEVDEHLAGNIPQRAVEIHQPGSDEHPAVDRPQGQPVLEHSRESPCRCDVSTGFFGQVLADRAGSKELRGRVRTLEHYLDSLGDHSSFVSQKVTFLLDATLGLINIEQSNIVKIFSIVAGVFLPPTLIATIYGMNFTFMPELRWTYGYPFAGMVMWLGASAVLVLQAPRLALTGSRFLDQSVLRERTAELERGRPVVSGNPEQRR